MNRLIVLLPALLAACHAGYLDGGDAHDLDQHSLLGDGDFGTSAHASGYEVAEGAGHYGAADDYASGAHAHQDATYDAAVHAGFEPNSGPFDGHNSYDGFHVDSDGGYGENIGHAAVFELQPLDGGHIDEQHSSAGGHGGHGGDDHKGYEKHVLSEIHHHHKSAPKVTYKDTPIKVYKAYLQTVDKPYGIKVPVSHPVAVPVVKELKVPVEKLVPFKVEKKIPFKVEKHVPYKVVKHVPVYVPKPYAIKVPIYKTIVHKLKSDKH